MRKANKKHDPLVKAVIGMTHGSVLTHDHISGIIDIERQTTEYYYTVTRATKELLPYGKMLKNIKDVGYKVLEPDNYNNESVRRTKMAGKHIMKAADVVFYAPIELMSPEAASRNTKMRDRLISFAAMVKGQETELSLLATVKPRIQVQSGKK